MTIYRNTKVRLEKAEIMRTIKESTVIVRFLLFQCLILCSASISFSQDYENFSSCYNIKDALKHPLEVRTLSLRNNEKMRSIPPEIGQLKNLRVLNVSGTNLTELPEEIGECLMLEEITANASQFRSIPNSIGQLERLRIINFAYNQIDSIPQSISNCTYLVRLNLSSNSITTVPNGFGSLVNLTYCNLSHNNLTQFSIELNWRC